MSEVQPVRGTVKGVVEGKLDLHKRQWEGKGDQPFSKVHGDLKSLSQHKVFEQASITRVSLNTMDRSRQKCVVSCSSFMANQWLGGCWEDLNKDAHIFVRSHPLS